MAHLEARRSPRGSPTKAWAWLFPAALAASAASLVFADSGALAIVGPIRIDTGFFLQRAARVSALDWDELGATWPERRRRFLEQVLVAEALLSLAAQRLPPTLPAARALALARTLEATIVVEAAQLPPSHADLRAYRERHRDEFQTPRRLGLWRILLQTEAEARAVIGELAPPTADAFSRIARERSVDPATRMRAGNLGLVAADGQTAVPELRVSAALFAAADRVGDGELVPEPVSESGHFAVVWRRSTRVATALPDADVSAIIAGRLAEARAADARAHLLEALRRDHLSEYHPEAAAAHEPAFPETSAPRLRLPRELGSRSGIPRLIPELTDRGLR